MANWLAWDMSCRVRVSCGKELLAVAEPCTGLSQPISFVIWAASSRLEKNFRKSTASPAFLLLALTRNPSGAPVSALVSPFAPDGAGSRKKSHELAMLAGAPPLVVSAGNSTDSMYCMAALPARKFACAVSWDTPLAFGVAHRVTMSE